MKPEEEDAMYGIFAYYGIQGYSQLLLLAVLVYDIIARPRSDRKEKVKLVPAHSLLLSIVSKDFRIGLIQLLVGKDKAANVQRAAEQIKIAKNNGSQMVILPECFNSPYGTKYFPEYAEPISSGYTCKSLSASAAENQIYVIGGSIPESDGDKLYNTCTVWGPSGELLTKYRKIHLFDLDIPNRVLFRESDTLTAGNTLTTFSIFGCKIGIGICYDIRFEQMARLYRNQGCDFLIYPGAFTMTTGPLHWELLQRARAVDNQVYVTAVSPARDEACGYIAWGHTTLVDPLGKVVVQAGIEEEIVYGIIDLDRVEEVRQKFPVSKQSRNDLYETRLVSRK
ncbi:omega-amidase NIT2-like [Anabrus simplex]|uniref:omega-amidase NIT2-like n=1 Tax=Anabrus simplex TaxID=316456 RepID=UPI0035A35A23